MDLETFSAGVAGDIDAETADGWHALSTSVLPARQVRGGVFDTGSTHTSMSAAVVLYAKD